MSISSHLCVRPAPSHHSVTPRTRWLASKTRLLALGLISLALAASTAQATTVWNEATDGDLSSDPAAPTVVVFSNGSNVIDGSVTAMGDTRDYVTFTVAPGLQMTGLLQFRWENATTGLAGNTGYHSLNLGATSEIPGGANGASFLGGNHLGALAPGGDMLAAMGDGGIISGFGAPGFDIPLAAGTYTYLVQQTSPVETAYSIDFVLEPIPEPGTALLLGLGLALAARRQRRTVA